MCIQFLMWLADLCHSKSLNYATQGHAYMYKARNPMACNGCVLQSYRSLVQLCLALINIPCAVMWHTVTGQYHSITGKVHNALGFRTRVTEAGCALVMS